MSKKMILRIAFLAAISAVLPLNALALGQMSEPIVIKNAIKGENIQQEIFIVNSDPVEVPVEFIAEGGIRDWTSFYLFDDLKTEISTTSIPARENLRAAVVFSVPKDVPGGEYEGAVSVVNIPPDENRENSDESYAFVRQKIDREVFITVNAGEEEMIDINNTSVIPSAYDIVPGSDLKIRVVYDNQGNVRVSPQIRATISRNGENVYDLIHPYPQADDPVNSLSQHEISPITVSTAGWEQGRYAVRLVFSQDDEEILDKDFTFTISAEAGQGGPRAENSDKIHIYALAALLLLAAAAVIIALASKKGAKKN